MNVDFQFVILILLHEVVHFEKTFFILPTFTLNQKRMNQKKRIKEKMTLKTHEKI